MVNVKSSRDSDDVIGRVKDTNNLDIWDGSNFSSGGVGYHKGITKLKDGDYVIIESTQHQGQQDFAYIVSDQEALEEVLKGHPELLETKKFARLKKLAEDTMLEEEE